MDRLPTELSQTICELVEIEDIQSLRLVSKLMKKLATPFLLSEVQLVFHPDSFERLLAISRHPELSKQVKILYYEPDALDKHETQKSWEKSIWDKRNLNFIPERPPLDASDEAFEAYRQASKEFHRRPRHTYSAEELDAGYVKYQELYRGQQDFKRAGYGNKELVEAMARLPNLHDFVMTMANCIEIASRYLGNFFAAGLLGPFGDTRNVHVDGVPQLQSIYRSAFLSGTKFKSFVCGDVGWQLFKSTKKDLAVLASVISESHRFSLQLSTGHDEQTDMLGSELRQRRRYLKNGRIRDLITQAEKLESLRFILDWSDPVFGVDLKNVVGDHTWTRLSHVSFGNMEGSEEDLVAFVERHALSLQRLHLETFSLTTGKWTTALPRIRPSFKNTPDVLIERDLLSQSPLRHFYLGEALWDSRRVPEEKTHIERRESLQESLQEWFKNGGDCPLVDEWSLV